MIADVDKVRHARARLSNVVGDYVAALEQRQRLAANGNDPTELEAAGRKVSAAQVLLVAAVRVHGEIWRSEHRQAYQSLVRELEGGGTLAAGYAQGIRGRG